MWKKKGRTVHDIQPLIPHTAPLSGNEWTALDVEAGLVEKTGQGESRYVKPRNGNVMTYAVNNKPTRLFTGLNGHVVFPTGIFYKSIYNPNSFPIEISFKIGNKKGFMVCVEPASACYDVQVLEAPGADEPTGQRWSERFGVITRALLEKGIIETRENGDRVVWRKFRHSPTKLTPFGMWCKGGGNCKYTVISPDEYEKLCKECTATRTDDVIVTIRPLFDNIQSHSECMVDLEARFPYLYSEISVGGTAENRV